MPNNPYFSLVFVNYQSAFELAAALKTLFSFERDHTLFEVIVVNNDRTQEHVLRALSVSAGFQLQTLPENSGFGTAANIGAALARGTVVGFINPDTLWTRPILSQVAQKFELNEEKLLLGIPLTDSAGRHERFSSGSAPRFLKLALSHLIPFLGEERTQSTDWVSGGALFVRRELFLEWGGFDTRFFLYFEDVDFCLRAKARGATIAQDHDVSLFHHGGRSFSSRESQKKFFYDSQERYYRKHRPYWEFFLIRWLHRFIHSRAI